MFEFVIGKDVPELIVNEVRLFINEWLNDSPYINVNTSGSTGTPKSISLEKEKMIVSAKNTLNYFQLKPNDSALLCLPISTIAGKMMVVRAIIGELRLIVGNVNSDPLSQINEEIDFVAMVPLQLHYSLEKNLVKLGKIKTILIGGGVISNDLHLELKRSNLVVYHSFGMTETISHVAIRKIGIEEELGFKALQGINFSIGKESNLIIHYPEIGLSGLITNDIVNLTSKDSFEWLSRADFVINSGGKKLYPELIENQLSTLIYYPFFIYGIPDDKLGEKVVLVVENSISLKLSKDTLNKILDKHSIPKEIIYIPYFVRTSSGKINRRETAKLIEHHVFKEIL